MNIKLIIDRIENNYAILKTTDNKAINWPLDKLPNDIKEGSSLSFLIGASPETADSKKELAKDILNEILDTDSN